MTDIQKELFALQDSKYREFHSRLVPTVSYERIIGVRVPEIRKLAKQLGIDMDFVTSLPHFYYEENNLHAFMLESLSFDECVREINLFLPYVDNWATCDSLRPKCFAKNKEKLILEIDKWLVNSHPYIVRFGIEMLMVHYLEGKFRIEYAEKVSKIHSDEYYVNMMSAWYFATALAKQYESILPYFENRNLDVWVHNKAIQKALESFRITPEQKGHLKELKIST